MERLTDDRGYCESRECYITGCYGCDEKQIYDRLRAYEQTGLSPKGVDAVKMFAVCKGAKVLNTFDGVPVERLVKLAQADEEGRLQALQKPQSPIYTADGYDEDGNLVYDCAECPACGKSFEEGVNDWGCAYCSDCGQRLDWSPVEAEEALAERRNHEKADK